MMLRTRWIATTVFFLLSGSASLASTGHPHGDDFDLDCALCHTVGDWRPLKSTLGFEHLATGFELDGAHSSADCGDCHESPRFSFVGTACADCHRDAHAGELGFDCEACHSSTGWQNQRPLFDAHASTLFPLLRPHTALDCDACHGEQLTHQFATTPTDCFSCHLLDFTNTTDPDHVAAGFATECETCHSPVSPRWDEAVFQHPGSFLLDGAHRRLGCDDCHASGFAGTLTDCAGCHIQDYRGTVDPDHATAGFPLECEVCHDTTTWSSAVFDHNATAFPLRGQHQPLDCEVCHGDGFAGTPTDCFACHRADYRATRDPDHVEAGFPTACETCHNESGWDGAVFDHDTTAFRLRNSHAGLDCEACHADGFAGTATDCFSCHADDYNRANDPDHAAAGFPTDCQNCHRPTTWDDSDWDHRQFFPIYTGEHRGVWDGCDECHVAPGNFRIFECILCHEHRKSEMDDEHDDVSGYRWESRACLECHPDGDED